MGVCWSILKSMQKKIGILTAGGDCAGLNAVIASFVKAAAPKGYECYGFIKGWNGVLEKKYRKLDLDSVRGISHRGGTILQTVNHGRFNAKADGGDGKHIPQHILLEAKETVDELGLDCLIVIGGDGSLSAAMQLAETGVKIVGVPKTIDNDLSGTDKTFGYSTAIEVAVESLDRIHTTASSHDRVFFVECMGRGSGWISLEAGLAANVNAILLPEFPVSVDELVEFLHQRVERRGSAIVVVSEGIKLPATTSVKRHDGQEVLQGAAMALVQEIEQAAPDAFEMRTVVLGHTVRGGTPNAEDRNLAKRYGIAAFEAYERGEFGRMVRVSDNKIQTIDILEAVGEIKRVTEDNELYQAAEKLGIYLNHS